MPTVISIAKRRPLAAFFAVTIGLGWLLTALMARLPYDPLLLPLLALPISYAPALVALGVLRLAGSCDEREAFWRRARAWRVGAGWYLLALTVGPAIYLAGVGLATAFGGRVPFHPALLAYVAAFLPVNLGEELGWRGYALPRLQDRLGALRASLVLGGAWGLFHLVANLSQPPAYFLLGTALMTALGIVMTWVFNRTGGAILLMTLIHASTDTMQVAAPLTETGVTLVAYALVTAVAGAVAGGLTLATRANLGRAATLPLVARSLARSLDDQRASSPSRTGR